MELLTGEYRNTLDEKGRILFPSRLRTEITGNVLIVTKSIDSCLWLYTPEEWKSLSEKIMGSASPFDQKARLVIRHLIAPAQEVEFDKAGRLSIPQSLREYAGLSKDCVVLGVNRFIELWDAAKYREYNEQNESALIDATSSLTDICF
ncbi:MAG: division/cell wall cluster transcriptional repressor MraZ [Treponema sp.]|nr:division/cell wall cluster transcriptional repressor MraZ [Candidatus Treponema caballi]